jgi:hypothetical protein
LLAIAWLIAVTGLSHAQTAVFTNTTPLTNREILLRLSAPAGQPYRIDSSTNLTQWHPLLTLSSTGLNQHADSAAPYLERRFYRAQQLTGTTNITGDYLTTTNGDVLIHSVRHASIVLTWNGVVIYNDPDTHPTPLYAGLPKAHRSFRHARDQLPHQCQLHHHRPAIRLQQHDRTVAGLDEGPNQRDDHQHPWHADSSCAGL